MRNARKNTHHLAAKGMVFLLCFMGTIGRPAQATVLEYDAAGMVFITETQTNRPPLNAAPTSTPSSNSAALRELTRNVAVQYAGSVGVRKAGLDALTFIEVFASLIERESAFEPFAVSEKGAKGLGQLMPKTAEDMGVADPFDPKSNLIGSAKYFTQQLQNFGKLDLALAAYNAGPERVKQNGGVPPFEETKAYVAWIFKKAGIEQKQAEVPIKAPAHKKSNIGALLKGDVSVWEF